MRHRQGSVVLDKAVKAWNFYWWVDGKRRSKRIGFLRDLPTKSAAWKATKTLRDAVEAQTPVGNPTTIVDTLVKQYRVEKMPKRFSTRHGYNAWLVNHIVPRWGELAITDVQARPVELWLATLNLAPKSKAEIRGLIRILWEFAMWSNVVPTQRNPMELVTVKGATKRTRIPRSLSVEEFQRFVAQLHEPFRTIALLCLCLGLRISECLALKWSDVNWKENRVSIERAIVQQHVDDVKTHGSNKSIVMSAELASTLDEWKKRTEFSAESDWMFASPIKLGRQPWSYPRIWQVFQEASAAARVGKLGTHTMRHSYRSWLDAVGTGVAVQQKLMRHADIRTTMNVYGDVVTNEMVQANDRVAGLAHSERHTEQHIVSVSR